MIKTSERGMVSIMVTFIMMIVISITVLSFAQIIRREQRQALDNQLSSQAFYAAETGINDARSIINKVGGVQPKTICGGDYQGETVYYDIDATTGYTCLLVDPKPDSIDKSLSIGEQSEVIAINPDQPLTSLTLTWKPEGGATPTAGCDSTLRAPAENIFTPATEWSCQGYGVIRLDLVPTTGAPGLISRSALMSNNFTTFVVPTTDAGAGTTAYAASNGASAKVSAAKCTSAQCSLRISLPNPSISQYYLRALPLYRSTKSFKITGNSGDVRFSGSQIVIDSTGRAQDVVRRIQVRVPVDGGDHADYGIQSTYSICKQFPTYYNSVLEPGFTDYQNTTTQCDEN